MFFLFTFWWIIAIYFTKLSQHSWKIFSFTGLPRFREVKCYHLLIYFYICACKTLIPTENVYVCLIHRAMCWLTACYCCLVTILYCNNIALQMATACKWSQTRSPSKKKTQKNKTIERRQNCKFNHLHSCNIFIFLINRVPQKFFCFYVIQAPKTRAGVSSDQQVTFIFIARSFTNILMTMTMTTSNYT